MSAASVSALGVDGHKDKQRKLDPARASKVIAQNRIHDLTLPSSTPRLGVLGVRPARAQSGEAYLASFIKARLPWLESDANLFQMLTGTAKMYCGEDVSELYSSEEVASRLKTEEPVEVFEASSEVMAFLDVLYLFHGDSDDAPDDAKLVSKAWDDFSKWYNGNEQFSPFLE